MTDIVHLCCLEGVKVDTVTAASFQPSTASLRRDLVAAGDRRDWDACDQIEKKLDK